MPRRISRPLLLLAICSFLTWGLWVVSKEVKYLHVDEKPQHRHGDNLHQNENKDLGIETESGMDRKRNSDMESIDEEVPREDRELQKEEEGDGVAFSEIDQGELAQEFQDAVGVEEEYGPTFQEKDFFLSRFQQRRAHMLATCSDLNVTPSNEDIDRGLRRMTVFFSQNTSVCTLGKAGSSTWREHMYRVNHIPHSIAVHDDPRLKAFKNQSSETLLASFMSTARILTVRHPFAKLASCYRSKFRSGSQMYPYNPRKKTHLGLDWATQFYTYWLPVMHTNGLIPKDIHIRLNLSQPIHPSIKYNLSEYKKLYNLLKPRVSFEHFLRHVVRSHKEGNSNGHWEKYQHWCAPCVFKYDYIVKIETMDKDLKYLFWKLGIPSDPNVRKGKTERKAKSRDFVRYYYNIPKDLRRGLYEVFKIDMDMFEYTLPDYFL